MQEPSRTQSEESNLLSVHERCLVVGELTLWLALAAGGTLALLGRIGQPWPAGMLLIAGAGALAIVRRGAARRFPASDRVPLSLVEVVVATVVVLGGALVLWASVMLVRA